MIIRHAEKPDTQTAGVSMEGDQEPRNSPAREIFIQFPPRRAETDPARRQGMP